MDKTKLKDDEKISIKKIITNLILLAISLFFLSISTQIFVHEFVFNITDKNILIVKLVTSLFTVTIDFAYIVVGLINHQKGKCSKLITIINKYLMHFVLVVMIISLILFSFKNSIWLDFENAQKYISIEWTIFAVLFAFCLMIIGFLLSYLFAKKRRHFNIDDPIDFQYHLIQQESFEKIFRLTFILTAMIVVNAISIYVGTTMIYPFDKSSYDAYCQWAVSSAMKMTMLTFSLLIIVLIYSVHIVLKMKKELGKIDDNDALVFMHEFIKKHDSENSNKKKQNPIKNKHKK